MNVALQVKFQAHYLRGEIELGLHFVLQSLTEAWKSYSEQQS